MSAVVIAGFAFAAHKLDAKPAAPWQGAGIGLLAACLLWLLMDALSGPEQHDERLRRSSFPDTAFSETGFADTRIMSVPRRRYPHEEITTAVEALRSAISERINALPALGHKAGQDPLTRLSDRASLHALSDWLDEHRHAHEVELCLLCVELKGLEPVKARYGVVAGDHVLLKVAKRLRDVSREEDFLFRLGSDEFVLMLPAPPGQGVAVARAVGKRVMASVQRPLPYLTVSNLAVSCSVGSAIWPADGEQLVDVLNFADTALADMRMAGRGGFKQYSSEDSHVV